MKCEEFSIVYGFSKLLGIGRGRGGVLWRRELFSFLFSFYRVLNWALGEMWGLSSKVIGFSNVRRGWYSFFGFIVERRF